MPSATEPARAIAGKETSAAMMGITTAVVIGTMVTAAVQAVTSTSLTIVQSAYAKIPRSRATNVQGIKHAVPPISWAIHVAMIKTTTAAAIGTVVIAAGKITTAYNTSTAARVRAWIRRLRSNAKGIVEVSTTRVTAAAMTITTIVVVNMMVETVVETAGTISNGPTVTIVGVRTRLKVDRTRRRVSVLL